MKDKKNKRQQRGEDLSSSVEDSPMETVLMVQGNSTGASSVEAWHPVQELSEEVAKLKEEVAKLKDKVQDLREQIIEVAELREQVKIMQAQNYEVAELMETIKRMQEQIDGLSKSGWPQRQWQQPRLWSQA